MTTESEEYEGEFEGGKYAGFGKLTRRDYTVEGSFKNGKLASKSAQLTTRDYAYSGPVENVLPHGKKGENIVDVTIDLVFLHERFVLMCCFNLR